MEKVRARGYIAAEAPFFPGDASFARALVPSILPNPMTKPEKRSFVPWFLMFATLFVLSLDFWWWDEPTTFAFLHVPPWVYYFTGLSLLFAGVMYAFTRHFWTDDDFDDPLSQTEEPR